MRKTKVLEKAQEETNLKLDLGYEIQRNVTLLSKGFQMYIQVQVLTTQTHHSYICILH